MSRPNRFRIVARIGAAQHAFACADPGRLDTLLRPGVPLRVSLEPAPGRRTSGTVRLVRHAGAWVSLVPVLANRLFEAAVRDGALPDLAGYRVVRREVRRGGSRFDFVLGAGRRRVLVEVKSVGLLEGATALFPDAPTARGRRHVSELAEHARRGGSAWVVFVVQRPGARRVRPHAAVDPDLAAALAAARRAGVELRGYACEVGERGAAIVRSIPVVA